MHYVRSTASRNTARALDAARSTEFLGCECAIELEGRRLPTPLEPPR